MSKKLTTRYADIVLEVLRAIENRMRDSGITMLALPTGYHEQKAFVVHIEHGDADPIEYISLEPRPYGLRLHGYSRTVYQYENYDSQDFHVIADPVVLLNVANAAIDVLVMSCRPKGNTKSDLVEAISDYVGPDGCIPFEHGFPCPSLPHHNLLKITEVREHTIVVREKKSQSVLPLETLTVATLKRVIDALNTYSTYCHLKA